MDLLAEDVIEPALRGQTRDDVIAELVDLLVRAGRLAPGARERALAVVKRREESQSTGLGSGVAVPHGLCDEVQEVVGALGLHRGGVEFKALDEQPVHLVILLLVPPNRYQAHIRTLAGIARVLNDPKLRRQLLAGSTAEEVLQILVQREEAAV